MASGNPDPINRNGDLMTASTSNTSDTIEELMKEVDLLKKKLEEERAKFNDVARESFFISFYWEKLSPHIVYC